MKTEVRSQKTESSETRSLAEIVEQCRVLLDLPIEEFAAQWKIAHPGVKLVGTFPVYAPVELVYAMGLQPVGLFGGGHKIEIQHADARFQSFVCSISKSTLELGLQKKLGDLDALLFESICDVARNLSSVFKRNFPQVHVEYIHLPQNMASAGVEDYLVAEYQRVADNLERTLGAKYSREGMEMSLRAFNASRRAWRELYDLRREFPHRLSTTDLYVLGRAGTRLTPQAHANILNAAQSVLKQEAGKPKDRIRVVVEGAFCEQPPVELLQMIEEAGCYIVDDDLLLGWRWFSEDLPVNGTDPLHVLASSYIYRSLYSSVRHDQAHPRTEMLLKKIEAAKAQAVIFLPAKFCEPALFDYVLFRKILDEKGIPHLMLEFEEKMWTFERARGEVETFVESLLFD